MIRVVLMAAVAAVSGRLLRPIFRYLSEWPVTDGPINDLREYESLLALEEVVRVYLALLDEPDGVADDDDIRTVLALLDAKRAE